MNRVYMKVAYLLGSLNRGGTETLLLDVFRSADKAPFSFVGIHRKGGAYRDDFYATQPVFLQCAPMHHNILSYIRRLRKCLQEQQVTIVHAQQYIDALYAKLATWGTGIKVVETFHGYDYATTRWEKILIQLSIRWSDAVCFVSNAQRQYYLRHYTFGNQEKTHVIYNGIDFSKLDVVSGPLCDLPSKIAPASRGMKLAMVGNFVRGRAQSSLCQFLLRLAQEHIPYDFYFVGKRDEKEPWRYDQCVQFCKDNHLEMVHFLGSRNDVPQILQQLDAFVYATDHDTFGIAVVEAMAAGVPVFVNDNEVMVEVTRGGEWATLYQTNNAEDLWLHFGTFIRNGDACKQQAQHIAQQVRQHYSIEHHLQQLYEVYKRQ